MTIEDLRTQLRGKKTYLLVAIAVLTALVGWADGQQSLFQAVQAVLVALGAGAARAGLAVTAK
jgi:hypothetical protein